MKKMLIILPRVPWPLEKGDKLRAYHQIRCLSKHNDIILFALNDNPRLNAEEARQRISKYCSEVHIFNLSKILIFWNIIKAFFTGKPLQVGYFYSCKAKKILKRIAEESNPNRIYCQLIRTVEYGRIFDIPKTIDYQDTFSQGMLRRAENASLFIRWFFKMEFRRLQRYEDKVFEWFDHKTIISKPDRDLLTHPKRDEVVIIPNGIDHDYFKPVEAEKRYDIIFNGNMSYPPNINASEILVRKIMPIVHQTMPEVTLLLSGASPHARVKALQSDKITVSGWVEDIRENYAASRIFVAPMQIGTGLQNKLLEAMCMQIPSITSALANASLNATPGRDILIGDTPESYARLIIDLLNHPEKMRSLAENGRQFVLNTFNWEHSTEILEQLISE
ncbi:MAG: glycosyltransferase [Bacteroidales bacterium]|jgi:sugar transferase (PEP-CTERM/EpsH1 system associated)|nr:glycosyltransferase [Bacteroidales bacterium]